MITASGVWRGTKTLVLKDIVDHGIQLSEKAGHKVCIHRHKHAISRWTHEACRCWQFMFKPVHTSHHRRQHCAVMRNSYCVVEAAYRPRTFVDVLERLHKWSTPAPEEMQ